MEFARAVRGPLQQRRFPCGAGLGAGPQEEHHRRCLRVGLAQVCRAFHRRRPRLPKKAPKGCRGSLQLDQQVSGKL